MISKLKRFRRDKGDSTLVSTIIVIPLIVGLIITTIDVSIFFSNRAFVVNATRDAARTVAIFGGDGDRNNATVLEVAYGSGQSSSCVGLQSPMIELAAGKNINTDFSNIECQLMRNLSTSAGLVNVKIKDISCGPREAGFIGEQAFCDLKWTYDGVPGSGLTFLRAAGNPNLAEGEGLEGVQSTRVTTTTEVKSVGLEPRIR